MKHWSDWIPPICCGAGAIMLLKVVLFCALEVGLYDYEIIFNKGKEEISSYEFPNLTLCLHKMRQGDWRLQGI